jgi:hypothetical protein
MSTTTLATYDVINVQGFFIRSTVPTGSTITGEHALFVRSVLPAIEFI